MAAWRQKQWKYKNTAPKLPKKEEWITGISASRLMQTAGNYIQSSSQYIAFNIDGHGGGALGVLPLNSQGPVANNLPILYAHGGFVSDFGFCPHDDSLLATCSFDNYVKLWRLSDVKALPSDTHVTFPELPKRADALQWNPLVSQLLTVCCGNLLRLYDVAAANKLLEYDCFDDVIQGSCWSLDGCHLLTTSKDRVVRLFDPRSNKSAAVSSGSGHAGVQDSRVQWVHANRFITTGFDSNRTREVNVYDTRNMNDILNKVNVDSNNGVLIPLFDADTGMLYLAGKGDNNVRFMESSDQKPYVVEAACDNLMQLKGACLIPKRSVNVMKGEVNRLLILSKDCVIPVPYIIPRRSYAEFHEDVFPDTYSGDAGCSLDEWLAGKTPQVVLLSLNPAKGGLKTEQAAKSSSSVSLKTEQAVTSVTQTSCTKSQNGSLNDHVSSKPLQERDQLKSGSYQPPIAAEVRPVTKSEPPPVITSTPHEDQPNLLKTKVEPKPSPLQTVHSSEKTENRQKSVVLMEDSATQTSPARTSQTFKLTVKSSKFRHLKGTPLHKSLRIDNIRNLSNTVSGESNGFALNRTRCAVALKGPQGILAVLELKNTGKLDDNSALPSLVHGVAVSDFKWCPFDDSFLVSATESGCLFFWNIPNGGLAETLECPAKKISAHNDRIYSIEFHPTAKDILASCAQDLIVKIWDLKSDQAAICLIGHSNPICSMAWSADGRFLATFSKDSQIRVYDPRSFSEPIKSGTGPAGTRGGRILWVLEDTFLSVSGFDKQSNRLLQLFDPNDLSVGVANVDLDTSPSILIPYYDQDSRTIFLTAKGDGIVQAFEVTPEPPYLQTLTSFHGNGQHQAFAFLPKICCNVREVEFAKAYRLTSNAIEPISFTVPRVRMEYFQDDLFPETSVTWQPTCTGNEWLAGVDRPQIKINLKPDDMIKLSDAPPEEVKERKYERFEATSFKTDAEKRDELVSAMSAKMDLNSEPLPQDLSEGVDPDEWD